MSLNGFSKTLLSLTVVSSICLSAFEATAASQCKGLEESACIDNQACTWISAYTTKNGNSISAYCRSTGGKGNEAVNKEKEKGLETGASGRSGPAAEKANNTEERRG
jgi:hypothetical protein